MAENRHTKAEGSQAKAERKPVVRRLGEVGGRTIVILAVITAAIAALMRLDLRLDWSADSRFSIQPTMAAIVDQLETEVEVVAIWTPESDEPTRDALIDYLDQRLRQIAALSPRLSYRVIDSVVDQPQLETFRETHGEALDGSIYLLGHGRPFRVPVTGMLRFSLQRDLGGALVTVSTRERLPVYVLQGHGELPWRGQDTPTLGQLLHRLTLAGMEFDPAQHALDPAALSRLGRIPDDGVLLIAGPTSPLGAEALAAVEAYLRDGGPALVLADHRCPSDLALLLRRWGLLVAGGVPLDLARIADEAGRPPLVLRSLDRSLRGPDRDFTRLVLGPENFAPSHPAVAQSANSGRPVVSPESTEVQAVQWQRLADELGPDAPKATSTWLRERSGPPLVEATWLAALDPADAWLAAPTDRTPPSGGPRDDILTLAYAASFAPHPESANPDRGSRIALWGSRQVAANRWVGDPQYANALLLTDLVAWLADRGASTPIALQQFASYQIDAEDGTMTLLMALLVVIVPCLCIGAAILTWWERR